MNDGGYFPFPNDVIDTLLSKLTGAEFKVLSIVIRQTLGWRRHWDRIAVSQFRKKGGMSKAGVVVSLDVLIENKLILCEKVKEEGKLPENWYALFGDTNEKDRLVRSPDQYDKQTSMLIILDLVRSVDQLGDKLVRSPAPQKKVVPKNNLKTPPNPQTEKNDVTTQVSSETEAGGGGSNSSEGERELRTGEKVKEIQRLIVAKFPELEEAHPKIGQCKDVLREFGFDMMWIKAAFNERLTLRIPEPSAALNYVCRVAKNMRAKGEEAAPVVDIEHCRQELASWQAERAATENAPDSDFTALRLTKENRLDDIDKQIKHYQGIIGDATD